MRQYQYEEATEYDGGYRVAGWPGIAFEVVGWQTEPNEDMVWTGQQERTGELVVCMVGDDRLHLVSPEDVTPIGDDYCHECGQIGCRVRPW